MTEPVTYLVLRGVKDSNPGVWIVQTADLKQLAKDCTSLHLDTWILALEPAVSQTEVPWGGMRCKEVLHLYPTEGYMAALTAACNHLMALSEVEAMQLTARGTAYLEGALQQHLINLAQNTELYSDPQTEVVDLPTPTRLDNMP